MLTDGQFALLKKLLAAFQLGASARGFRDDDRLIAVALGKLGLARLHGSSWRVSFWSITEAGREFLAVPPMEVGVVEPAAKTDLIDEPRKCSDIVISPSSMPEQ